MYFGGDFGRSCFEYGQTCCLVVTAPDEGIVCQLANRSRPKRTPELGFLSENGTSDRGALVFGLQQKGICMGKAANSYTIADPQLKRWSTLFVTRYAHSDKSNRGP